MSKDREENAPDLESPDLSVKPSTTLLGPPDDGGEVAVDASAIAVTPPAREEKPRKAARAPVVSRSEKPTADATLLGLPNEPAAPPPAEPNGAMSLSRALSTPVRIAGSALPLWAPVLCGVLIACTLAVGVGALGDRSVPAAAPDPTTTTAADSIAAESLEDRAAAGDPEAIALIAGRPTEKRTSREVIALSQGRRARAVGDAQELARRLAGNAALRHDPEVQTQLRKYAHQAETHREALGAIALLPGSESADMLYAIWTGTAARTDVTRLAEELVYSADVRAKASPSLSVVLDLWRADNCEAVKAVLTSVAEHGDHRALGRLNLLRPTAGCGDDALEDCYPCLRDDDVLDQAIAAASRRPPPR